MLIPGTLHHNVGLFLGVGSSRERSCTHHLWVPKRPPPDWHAGTDRSWMSKYIKEQKKDSLEGGDSRSAAGRGLLQEELAAHPEMEFFRTGSRQHRVLILRDHVSICFPDTRVEAELSFSERKPPLPVASTIQNPTTGLVST